VRNSFNEFMLRVSWSTDKHPDQRGADGEDGQVRHCRRGEVMLDLGLAYEPGDDFTADEMQEIARAAKMAAHRVLRLRKSRLAKSKKK
jgi:hypothetical protein